MTVANTFEDFHRWYIPEPMSGCWLWLGHSPNGRYGAFKLQGKRVQAHVLSYNVHHGEIPEGHIVHHRCRNTFCVNPEHLQTLTQLQNMRLQPSASKTHCVHGHSYTDGMEIYVRPTP